MDGGWKVVICVQVLTLTRAILSSSSRCSKFCLILSLSTRSLSSFLDSSRYIIPCSIRVVHSRLWGYEGKELEREGERKRETIVIHQAFHRPTLSTHCNSISTFIQSANSASFFVTFCSELLIYLFYPLFSRYLPFLSSLLSLSTFSILSSSLIIGSFTPQKPVFHTCEWTWLC